MVKHRLPVANMVLRNAASEVLMLQRSDNLRHKGVWGLPGGVIDTGESAVTASVRELYEETGIATDRISVAGLRRFLIDVPNDEDLDLTCVSAALTDDSTIELDPWEHVAYTWMSPQDICIASNLMPGLPTMIAHILGVTPPPIDTTMSSGMRIYCVQ